MKFMMLTTLISLLLLKVECTESDELPTLPKSYPIYTANTRDDIVNYNCMIFKRNARAIKKIYGVLFSEEYKKKYFEYLEMYFDYIRMVGIKLRDGGKQVFLKSNDKKVQVETADNENTQVEKANAETIQVESTQVEEANAETTQAEKVQAEKANAETTQVESTQVEEANAETTQAEKVQAEKANAETTQVESTQVEEANDEKAQDGMVQAEKANDENTQAEKANDENTQLGKKYAESLYYDMEWLNLALKDKSFAQIFRMRDRLIGSYNKLDKMFINVIKDEPGECLASLNNYFNERRKDFVNRTDRLLTVGKESRVQVEMFNSAFLDTITELQTTNHFYKINSDPRKDHEKVIEIQKMYDLMSERNTKWSVLSARWQQKAKLAKLEKEKKEKDEKKRTKRAMRAKRRKSSNSGNYMGQSANPLCSSSSDSND